MGGYVAYTAIGEGYETFPLHAGAAALITSVILWWLIVERPQAAVSGRGFSPGLLAVCWPTMYVGVPN